jgi:hypothetical protein
MNKSVLICTAAYIFSRILEGFVEYPLTWKHICTELVHRNPPPWKCINFVARLWFPQVYTFSFSYPWASVKPPAMICVHESYLCRNVSANSSPRNAYMSQYNGFFISSFRTHLIRKELLNPHFMGQKQMIICKDSYYYITTHPHFKSQNTHYVNNRQ